MATPPLDTAATRGKENAWRLRPIRTKERRARNDRLQQQRLAGAVGDAAGREAPMLHAGLARPGDPELVAHANGEDRHRMALGRDLADVVGKAADHAVLL